jgi:hypothetical protein
LFSLLSREQGLIFCPVMADDYDVETYAVRPH